MSEPSADPNTLLFFPAPAEAYRSPLVSRREVFCGPDCVTREVDGQLRSLESPAGSVELAALLTRLPAAQRPELLVVRSDPAGRNQPRGLAAFRGPKVLLVGDTHQPEGALQRAVRYATEEPFDFVILDQSRQHGHFFLEAGLPHVSWIPAFAVAGSTSAWREPVERQVVLVGQIHFHPHRRHLLRALERAGVSIRRPDATPAEPGEAPALVNVHCSANGELDRRIFTVLSSGGFLLTDRLGPESGLDRLFTDGEHLVCYDGIEDLQLKIEHHLAHPTEARRVARAGWELAQARHQPAHKIAALMHLLGGGTPPEVARIEGPWRAVGVGIGLDPALEARLSVYQHLQELHRTELAPVALFADGCPPRVVADAADLPRLRLLVGRGDSAPAMLSRLRQEGLPEGRVAVPGEWELEDGVLELDALVLGPEATGASQDDDPLDHADTICLTEEPAAPALARLERRLRARGFVRIPGAQPPRYHLEDEVTIGERHFASGEPEEAARHFRTALAADPDNVRALNDLAVVSQLYGETEGCIRLLERALRIDGRDPETLVNLADILLRSGRSDEARRLCTSVDRRAPLAPPLRERLSTIEGALGSQAAESR
jgi:tetratricopeptide (TPR) repeat protein